MSAAISKISDNRAYRSDGWLKNGRDINLNLARVNYELNVKVRHRVLRVATLGVKRRMKGYHVMASSPYQADSDALLLTSMCTTIHSSLCFLSLLRRSLSQCRTHASGRHQKLTINYISANALRIWSGTKVGQRNEVTTSLPVGCRPIRYVIYGLSHYTTLLKQYSTRLSPFCRRMTCASPTRYCTAGFGLVSHS